MATTETWTIGRLLQWTGDFLRKHGAASPRLDAEVLLAEILGIPRIQLYTSFDVDPGDAVRTKFRELVRRRAAGEPVAYLVGHREFFSLNFAVTPDVLVPRPETEFVVIALLDSVRQFAPAVDRPLRIADVGTGSGVLAICAAKHVPACRVAAIDISPAALEVACRNIQTHGVGGQIETRLGDLLSDLPAEPTFDFIVSNPPYVSERELAETAVEVREHEPRLALLGGENGDEILMRLVPQAAERLVSGGWLISEISPMLESRAHALITEDGRFEPPVTRKDLAGLARVVLARRR